VVLADPGWRRALPDVAKIVRRAARTALSGARRRGRQTLVVALADDAAVQALNRRDRGFDKPTNVLSYPSGRRQPLGDIVLARETVAREARAQRKTLDQHLTHLVMHGTLHLLGYDHERDADALIMEALETRLLARLGIPDPYAPAR